MIKRYSTIIWDWNGTLLDDVNLCISSINPILKKRGLKQIDLEYYKEIFTFPVIEYYKKLGFDFKMESFDGPAHEFIENYHNNFNSTRLQPGVEEILFYFKQQKVKQYILSAMEQQSLKKTVEHYKLSAYFNELVGIDNHYAHSKIDYGKKLINSNNLSKADTCLIGDTIHDIEVSKELGIDCIIIANGHQYRSKFDDIAIPIFDDLLSLKQSISKNWV